MPAPELMAIAMAAREPTGCACEDPNASNGAVDAGMLGRCAPAPKGKPFSRVRGIVLGTLAKLIVGGGPAAAAIDGEKEKNVVSKSGGGGRSVNSSMGGTSEPSRPVEAPLDEACGAAEALKDIGTPSEC